MCRVFTLFYHIYHATKIYKIHQLKSKILSFYKLCEHKTTNKIITDIKTPNYQMWMNTKSATLNSMKIILKIDWEDVNGVKVK